MRCLPPTWQINTLDGREHETESLNVSSTRTVNLYARAYDKYTHTHTKPEPLAGPFLYMCVCGKFGGKRQSDMSNILHCWILFGVIAL